MKILVTGGKGQLGNEIRRILTTGQAEIGAIDPAYQGAVVDYVDSDVLDIGDAHAVYGWFAGHGPYDLTINCAAVTNVDGCEKNEALALRVNAFGAENLAREVARTGGKFVHVSTDYVFPGKDEAARTESDAVCPISAYGRSKWAGEVLVRAACPNSFVVRTAWLYGYVGKNFVKTMVRLAGQNGRISVVADQVGNPTNANDLAYEILAMALTENYGTYHCTNEGIASWFEFACAVVDLAGIPCEREPLTSGEYKRRFPASADRPRYSALENKHLADTIGNRMRPWRQALESYMSNLPSLGN
jgi:dTDP-4-dehydrorhamnose reductase